MNITVNRLSLNKGSTLQVDIPIELPKEHPNLTKFRVLAYIKRQRTDTGVLMPIESTVVNGSTIRLFISNSRSANLPVGEFLYFVEAIKGPIKISGNNFINIEP